MLEPTLLRTTCSAPWLTTVQKIKSLVGSCTFFFPLIFPLPFAIVEPLSSSDNTARVLTRRSGFRQQEQSVFYLPILISDNGQPVLSSTGTLTIQVCSCDDDGHVLSCSPEAYMLPVSLSRGALIAILACIFVLLGKWLLSIPCDPARAHAESTKSSSPGSPLELASTLCLLKRQERKAGGSKKSRR